MVYLGVIDLSKHSLSDMILVVRVPTCPKKYDLYTLCRGLSTEGWKYQLSRIINVENTQLEEIRYRIPKKFSC